MASCRGTYSLAQFSCYLSRLKVSTLKGGEGGVIVLSTREDPVWTFNTLGMFRARQIEGGQPLVIIGK